MRMENAQNRWSVPVAVDDIPETGLHIEVEAPAEVRAPFGIAAHGSYDFDLELVLIRARKP